MTSPAYVFHATGAMKALLDHFAYRWIPHRPAPEMFGKRAVIITQCLGSGAKSAAKDMKHSLSWWGISKIEIFTGALMSDIVWEKLPQKKQAELAGKLQKLSRKFAHIDYTKPAYTNLITKFKFFFCRMMQKSIHRSDPEYLDGKYWAEQGWLYGKILLQPQVDTFQTAVWWYATFEKSILYIEIGRLHYSIKRR